MNLLGRARKWLGDGEPAGSSEPQFYRVTCPEGHQLRGQRTEGYQSVRCPACGRSAFVLPRSPFPEPPRPANQRPGRPRTKTPSTPTPTPVAPMGSLSSQDLPPALAPVPSLAGIEIIWQDDDAGPTIVPANAPGSMPTPSEKTEAAASSSPSSSPAYKARAAKPAAAKATAPAPVRPRPAVRPAVAAAPALKSDEEIADSSRPAFAEALGESGRRVMRVDRPGLMTRLARHKLALILGAVLFLVAGTVWSELGRKRREMLPGVAEASRREGLAALESGQFDLARKKLGEAADALTTLRDGDAAEVVHLAAEAAIFADLVGRSLPEILDQAATRSDGPEWFQSVFRGRTILIDDTLAGDSPSELHLRVLAGARHAVVDVAGLPLLEGKTAGDPVTFGARLRSLELGGDGVWHFKLDPSSGVFVSTPPALAAYEHLGGPPRTTVDDETMGPSQPGRKP